MTKHWHAGMNVPGYLPEGDVLTFETESEAIEYANDLKDQLENDDDFPYECTGQDGDYYCFNVDGINSGNDLGLHIWIEECDLEDCELDEE